MKCVYYSYLEEILDGSLVDYELFFGTLVYNWLDYRTLVFHKLVYGTPASKNSFTNTLSKEHLSHLTEKSSTFFPRINDLKGNLFISFYII